MPGSLRFNRLAGVLVFSVLLVQASLPIGGAGNVWSSKAPVGGKVSAMTSNLENPAIVYAAKTRYGMSKGTDGGASWARMGSPELKGAVDALVIAPQNPAIIYTERTRPVDDGASWVAINSPYFISRTKDPQSPSVRCGGTASDAVVNGLPDISSTPPSATLTVRSLYRRKSGRSCGGRLSAYR
jgi:hypothetical protein